MKPVFGSFAKSRNVLNIIFEIEIIDPLPQVVGLPLLLAALVKWGVKKKVKSVAANFSPLVTTIALALICGSVIGQVVTQRISLQSSLSTVCRRATYNPPVAPWRPQLPEVIPAAVVPSAS